MNMLPGDTKALSPSGLRLGVPELTRLGMGKEEMDEVAHYFERVLLDGEDPASRETSLASRVTLVSSGTVLNPVKPTLNRLMGVKR